MPLLQNVTLIIYLSGSFKKRFVNEIEKILIPDSPNGDLF